MSIPSPTLPICSYPSTAVVIDDDPTWSQVLAREVETLLPCITFQRPVEAVSFLTEHPHHTFAERCFEQTDSLYNEPQYPIDPRRTQNPSRNV